MDKIREEYIKWLINKVNNRREYDEYVAREKAKNGPEHVYDFGWTKLFTYLSTVEFRYTHPMDRNRYEDGLSVRWQYEYEEKKPKGTSDLITGPCSMLEMMYALADRMEGIVNDPELGDRTYYWIQYMLRSLRLNSVICTNEYFDQDYVDTCLNRFFEGDYEPDGHGGLFIVYDCEDDLRKLQIWSQMERYIHRCVA